MWVVLTRNTACRHAHLRGHHRARPANKVHAIELNIIALDIVVAIDARRAGGSVDGQLVNASAVDGLGQRVERRKGG